MCGTAGLFVGCQVESSCPRRLLTGGIAATGHPDEATSSPLSNWYARATVRTAPRREVAPLRIGEHFFPPELVPVAKHPLVLDLAPDRLEQVLIRHLYRYLRFTVYLETMVVNHTALGVATGSAVPDLSPSQRLDAFRIYCDEAYHALFCSDLIQQVERASGVAEPAEPVPAFMSRLGTILAGTEPEHRSIIELMFVIVSETLITGTLAQVHTRPHMAPAVAKSVQDHALDEGRHHVFFADLLTHVWQRLSPAQATAVGVRLPELIACFLTPDPSRAIDDLISVGIPRRRAQEVVDETFGHESVKADIRRAASSTIRRFTDIGAMEIPEVCDALAGAGLIPGASKA